MADAVKTKPQTGLAITRNKNAFVLSWKFGDKDYGDGQTCRFRPNLDPFEDLTIGPKSTSKTGTVNYNNYYPHKTKYLTRVQFALRGNRTSYKENQKVNGKTVKVTIDPTMSEWVYKEFEIRKPATPKLSAALSGTYSNVTTFSWSETVDVKSHVHFADCEYQTILVKESGETDGSKLSWKSSNAGWQTDTTGATGSISITEEPSRLAGASYTRWVRVRARGAAGASAWKYAKHVYARPNQAKISNVSTKQTDAGGYLCTVSFNVGSPPAHPVDKVTIQYCLAIPTYNMECPDSVTWTDAGTVRDTVNAARFAFSIDTTVSTDQCLFVRVNTEHDRNVTYGAAKTAVVGKMADPTGLSVTDIDDTNFRATVTATNVSQIPDGFLEVRYITAKNTAGTAVGIIQVAQGASGSVTVQCPNWSRQSAYGFKVRAVVGSYRAKTSGNLTTYTVNAKMHSAHWVSYGGSIPQAPSDVTLSTTDIEGTIRVAFDWAWQKADAAELSWADHEDAWESTAEPETYIIRNTHSPQWNISGLEMGKTWYVRVRLMVGTDDDATYGTYSNIESIDLASAPITPVLSLSSGVVTQGEELTASWVYTSTDGTGQTNARVAECIDPTQPDATYISTTDSTAIAGKRYYTKDTNNKYHYIDLGVYSLSADTSVNSRKTYYTRSGSGTAASPYRYSIVARPSGNPHTRPYYEFSGTYRSASGYYERNYVTIVTVKSAQQVDLNTSDWTAGEEHTLAVRVTSASGKVTDWSDAVSVVVAEPITCEITQTSLGTESEEIDGETVTTTVLTELPLTVTATGATEGGTTTISIVRRDAYHIDRPDESTFNGFEGETVAQVTQGGNGQMTITSDDLLGYLDDGAWYTLIATVTDELGQSAEASIDFNVNWSHQASIPDGTVTADADYIAAMITPTAPDDALATDVCDIYRLSVDKPRLIYSGATFGETYVDPYPTIGTWGGYRLVTRTADGDYTTTDGEIAWVDIPAEVESDYSIIDFDGGRVALEYNLDLSNKWAKDFKQTAYLGGSVQGDWNPAVKRTGTVQSVAIATEDIDTIESLRRLAEHAGICNVRTKEGSSYPADVQVSESYSLSNGHKIPSFSLSITRVDSEGYDGMTLAEWQALHEEG